MKLNRENGFTLVELMLVIAIIGIISAITTISSRDIRERYRIKSAARTLYSDLQLARLGAIRDGRLWTICFSPGDDDFTSYTIGNAGGVDEDVCTWNDDPPRESDPPDPAVDDPAVFRKNVDLIGERGIRFTEIFPGTQISFDPRGTASNGNFVVSRTLNAVMGQQITVNGMTGNIRIETIPLP